MSNFQGIAPDGMFLLAENRFHDSKSYYEEHKLYRSKRRCSTRFGAWRRISPAP